MLDRVTITGADDNTSIEEMVAISKEFPFVEWGILVAGAIKAGGTRFPSLLWQLTLAERAARELRLSLHVCGQYVANFLRIGYMSWPIDSASLYWQVQRVQLNTHGAVHMATNRPFDTIEMTGKQFIFQLDDVNDYLFDTANYQGLNCAGLFDTSYGAGKLPASWLFTGYDERYFSYFGYAYFGYFGYAGGLGPENVVQQVEGILAQRAQLGLGKRPFWIDMETRVRTAERLDMDKVRKVLELCKPYIAYVHCVGDARAEDGVLYGKASK